MTRKPKWPAKPKLRVGVLLTAPRGVKWGKTAVKSGRAFRVPSVKKSRANLEGGKR